MAAIMRISISSRQGTVKRQLANERGRAQKRPGTLFPRCRAQYWQRPTLAQPIDALPSAQQRFTSVFGMGTGGTAALDHQISNVHSCNIRLSGDPRYQNSKSNRVDSGLESGIARFPETCKLGERLQPHHDKTVRWRKKPNEH